jgi:hypothetical protein
MMQNSETPEKNSGRMQVNRELSPWLREHLSAVNSRNTRMAIIKPALGDRTNLLLRQVKKHHRLETTQKRELPLSRPFTLKGEVNKPAPSNWGEMVLLLSQTRGSPEEREEPGMRPRTDTGRSVPNRPDWRSSPAVPAKTRFVSSGKVEDQGEIKPRPKISGARMVRGKIEEDSRRSEIQPVVSGKENPPAADIHSVPEFKNGVIENKAGDIAGPANVQAPAAKEQQGKHGVSGVRNQAAQTPSPAVGPLNRSFEEIVTAKPANLSVKGQTTIDTRKTADTGERLLQKPGQTKDSVKIQPEETKIQPELPAQSLPPGISKEKPSAAQQVKPVLPVQNISPRIQEKTANKETPESRAEKAPQSEYDAKNITPVIIHKKSINTNLASPVDNEKKVFSLNVTHVNKPGSSIETKTAHEKESAKSGLSSSIKPAAEDSKAGISRTVEKVYEKARISPRDGLSNETPTPRADTPAEYYTDEKSALTETIQDHSTENSGDISSEKQSAPGIEMGKPAIARKRLNLDIRPVIRRIFRRQSPGRSTQNKNIRISSPVQPGRPAEKAVEAPVIRPQTDIMEPANSAKEIWVPAAGTKVKNDLQLPSFPFPDFPSGQQPGIDNVPANIQGISMPVARPHQQKIQLASEKPEIEIKPERAIDPAKPSEKSDLPINLPPEIGPVTSIMREPNETSPSSTSITGPDEPATGLVTSVQTGKKPAPGRVERIFRQPRLTGRKPFTTITHTSAASKATYQPLAFTVVQRMNSASPQLRNNRGEDGFATPYFVRQPALDLPHAAPPHSRIEADNNPDMKIFRRASGAPQPTNTGYYSTSQPAETFINRSVETGPSVHSSTPTKTGEKNSAELKTLARDIYPYIKRMIRIEKERLPNL